VAVALKHGTVLEIFTAPKGGVSMTSQSAVEAVSGRGLVGDRYYLETGTFSHHACPDRQVTLIEREVLDWLAESEGITLSSQESRRNIVTSGVDLVALVGKTFRVGSALLEGIRINEPCRHLEELTGKSLVKPLLHRSGINCAVVEGGMIRVGDAISEA